MERSQPRPSDYELVEAELTEVWETGGLISDACARVIASQVHSGQASATCEFSTTGAITERLIDELARDADLAEQADELELAGWLNQLVAYVNAKGEREPVRDWHKIWLRADEQVFSFQPEGE